MRTARRIRIVTAAAIALLLLGLGLLALPFALPTPDPVRIEIAAAVGDGARIDLRVVRRGRLAVEIRTTTGAPLRMVLAERAVSPGRLSVGWDGRSGAGAVAPPGSYVVRATAYPGVRPFVIEQTVRVGR